MYSFMKKSVSNDHTGVQHCSALYPKLCYNRRCYVEVVMYTLWLILFPATVVERISAI